MIYQNTDFEKPKKEINCAFGDAIRELQVSRILKQSNIKGKSDFRHHNLIHHWEIHSLEQ